MLDHQLTVVLLWKLFWCNEGDKPLIKTAIHGLTINTK